MKPAPWLRGLLAAACATAALAAAAQGTYPNQTVKLLVPWAPGGATDVQARLLAPGLERALGQPVVVDNRGGASGVVGTQQAARSPADGHTLLMGSIGPNAVVASLVPNLPYDVLRDFVPVALTAVSPNVFVVHPSVPANTLPDLLALLRSQPGRWDYASPGNGTSNHLAMELLKLRAGVRIVPITYRGSGPAMSDVMAGHVPLMFNNIDVVLPHVRAGKLRALAITGEQRSPLLPEVPTMAEAGIRDFTVGAWFGLFVPAGTPAPVVARLHAETTRLLASPELTQRLDAMGVVPGRLSQPAFADFVRQEVQRWSAVVREAGIKAE
jgi:tripartite-type tricarboxylate transporter receptor subunit TctC